MRSHSWDVCADLFSDNSPSYFFEQNPLRITANGKPMFRIRTTPWSDDVSGNVSKQYNAHTNIYATNANLPHEKLSQEYFVRFCSTSSFASSSEQFVALAEDLCVTQGQYRQCRTNLVTVPRTDGMKPSTVNFSRRYSSRSFHTYFQPIIHNNRRRHPILV